MACRRLRAPMVLAPLVAALLAGCSGAAPGTAATAAPAGTAASARPAASLGARPRNAQVVQPLSSTILCNVLTTDQVQASTGLVAIGTHADGGSADGEPRCDLVGLDGAAVVTIVDDTAAVTALADTPAAVVGAMEARGARRIDVAGADICLLDTVEVPPSGVVFVRSHWVRLILAGRSDLPVDGALDALMAEAAAFLSVAGG